MEVWKPAPGYVGRYEVSSYGRVRSLMMQWGKLRQEPLVLKPAPNRWGYLHVVLCRNGKMKNSRVHKLVAVAFLGQCPDGMEVNHVDGDKKNNELENLEYMTHQENMDHAKNVLKRKLGGTGGWNRGLREGGRTLTQEKRDKIVELLGEGFDQYETARQCGVTRSMVQRVLNRFREAA